MGNLKTCDIHDKEFPANLIDTDKHQMYRLFIEKTEQDPKDAKKKLTTTVFVGSANSEGVDVCHACMMNAILPRIQAMGRVTWKSVKWEKTTDAEGKEKLQKVVREVGE